MINKKNDSPRFQKWTDAEMKTLKAKFKKGGLDAAVRALPGRSGMSILKKCDAIGLKEGIDPFANSWPKWTPKDSDLVLQNIMTKGAIWCADQLPHRSMYAVIKRPDAVRGINKARRARAERRKELQAIEGGSTTYAEDTRAAKAAKAEADHEHSLAFVRVIKPAGQWVASVPAGVARSVFDLAEVLA